MKNLLTTWQEAAELTAWENADADETTVSCPGQT